METLIKEKTFVDVILPNYNKAEFLEESINSVTTQTYNNWKLFVIDDSSQDDSKKIINNYKSRNIKAIYLYKNKGVAFCRNLGIRLSDSKYISFIDSDDCWSQNKLEEQILFMEKLNYEFTYTDYTPFVVKNNKKFFKKKIIVPNSFTYDQFINNTSIGMSSVIIRRSIIGTTRFRKLKICEDYFFKCQILKKVNFAYCLSENLMKYRIRKNSLQNNKIRNFYWIWYINKNYNQLNFLKNLLSIFCISINSIKKYGFK